jgi:MFS superfamily sulfate permease-like transporter
MRHIFFVLILSDIFTFNPEYILVVVLILNIISMSSSKKMTTMLRSQAKTAFLVILVNVSLILSLLLPILSPYIAFIFFVTYLYAFSNIINFNNET